MHAWVAQLVEHSLEERRVSSSSLLPSTIRTRKGMSQGDICRALDTDRGYISSVENAKRNPTLATVEKIAKAFGVSIGDLTK